MIILRFLLCFLFRNYQIKRLLQCLVVFFSDLPFLADYFESQDTVNDISDSPPPRKTSSSTSRPINKKCNSSPRKKKKLSVSLQKKTFSEDTGIWMCDYCGKILSSHTNLKRHKMIHTNDVKFRCTRCNQFFESQTKLDNHNREKHPSPLTCKYCNKILSSSFTLQQHTRRHIKDMIKFRCNICNRLYESQKELDKHNDRVGHKDSGRKWPCEYCCKFFVSHSNLNRHLKIHTTEVLFRCDICSKILDSQTDLDRHNENHDLPMCEHCGKNFKRPCLLKKHLLKHHTALVRT